MKVLVSGGRDFADWPTLWRVLDEIHEKTPITLLVHGAARGADTLARYWAAARGVPETGDKYRVNWDAERRADPVGWRKAGQLRNARMLAAERPDLVVAFPTGGPGTAGLMHRARKAGVEVIKVPSSSKGAA